MRIIFVCSNQWYFRDHVRMLGDIRRNRRTPQQSVFKQLASKVDFCPSKFYMLNKHQIARLPCLCDEYLR